MVAHLRHPDWYLISGQRFRRRSALGTTMQVFRGETFLVISDRLTGQHMRLNHQAEQVWRMLDGERTVQEIWEELRQRPGTTSGQSEIMDWILQLVSAGLVVSDHEMNPEHLADRSLRKRNKLTEARAMSPLSLKFRLLDPARLIRATYPLVGWLFTRTGFALICAILLSGAVAAALNFSALTNSVDGQLLSQSGLLLLVLVFPVMKILHELSHGYAVHRFGGEVREFGIMLLVFFPVPYVEASDAHAFPDKRARMIVGAAGIISELLMASLALFVWLAIEPGIERALLFNVVLIGTVSTVLFNGNPLLKFDAYFVLSDWLEMPNLAKRSSEYLADRAYVHVFGLRSDLEVPPDEARILGTYGSLALLYRLSLTIVIVAVVSQMFFALGVLLALWAVVLGVIVPFAKFVRKGVRMSRAQNRSRRSALRVGALLGAIVLFGAAVPLPFNAMGQGMVVPAPGTELRMASAGTILPGALEDGAPVSENDVIVTVANRPQEARVQSLRLTQSSLEDKLSRGGLPLEERQSVERDLVLTRGSLVEAELRHAGRELTAPAEGIVRWQGGRPPVSGSFLTRGDLLGHIEAPGRMEIVLAFPSAYAGEFPGGDVRRMELLLPDTSTLSLPIARMQVVAAGQQVPRQLLSTRGGPVPEMPDAPGMALDAAIVAWAATETDLTDWSGARVKARLSLPDATAFEQVAFHLRRLFLRVIRV
ncbi:PqqD family peptide modification chaperone [Histidinibacterium aquaticum]|uniref:PqqD family peptide modification chaperone n=1 Tax=Histidinibacterium aquaticum TaxID=2613962 RepID=A0A5J5GPG4_9RHOB|nr:PqqD family peptide modification chaperone [Histidinibacterium aquaticum]KAA9009468.1 PqqD family peptide modification chaperone [Histidinibacterium aquaticum]